MELDQWDGGNAQMIAITPRNIQDAGTPDSAHGKSFLVNRNGFPSLGLLLDAQSPSFSLLFVLWLVLGPVLGLVLGSSIFRG